jgi:hypothetical protein
LVGVVLRVVAAGWVGPADWPWRQFVFRCAE